MMSFEHPEFGSRSAYGLDALLPREIAEKAEEIGARKARLDLLTLLVLSVLGGAFIALGSVYWFVYLRKRPRP